MACWVAVHWASIFDTPDRRETQELGETGAGQTLASWAERMRLIEWELSCRLETMAGMQRQRQLQSLPPSLNMSKASSTLLAC